MKLSAILGLDATQFTAGMGSAVGGVGALRSALSGVLGPLAALTGGVLSLGAAAGALRRSVSEAARMEDLETSFTTLLGSADAARTRMEDLANFAASTPFELPGIAQASRLLQAFTGNALSTGDGLRLVGDAAAAVGQPLEAVSMWFGRLYSALREGQPLGEPIQNLTQLGLISGDARRQLMALQGTAQDAGAAMRTLNTVFGTNAGAMERLSQTYNGRLSTLRDTVSAVYRELGTPIRDALKPFIERSTSQLEGLIPLAGRVGTEIAAVLSVAGASIANGDWPQLLGDVVSVALAGAVNTFSGALVGAVAGSMSLLSSDQFWKGALVGVAALGAALLNVFMRPLTFLQAGMDTIVGKLYEALGKIPVVGEKLGLDGFTGATFEQNLADREKNGFFLRDAANSAVGDTAALTGFDPEKLIGTFQEAAEAFKEGFAGGDLIDVSATRAKLAEALSAARDQVVRSRQAAPAAGAGAAEGLTSGSAGRGIGEIITDRLAKMGGFIGGAGGPAVDYARRTAAATERLVNDLRRLPTEIGRAIPAQTSAWA